MILRLWRGWTDAAGTAPYEDLLTGTVAPGIVARGLPGLRDLTVLRRLPGEREAAAGAEFLTAMTFDDLTAVSAFTGGDPHGSVVPPAARALLSRFDEHSRHYEAIAAFRA
jgi:hypothetical protein